MTADGGYRRGQIVPLKQMADEALSETPSIKNVVVVQRQAGAPIPVHIKEGRDHWYHRLMQDAAAECEPEAMDAEDMLYILYTSGTTGKAEGHRAHDRRLPAWAPTPRRSGCSISRKTTSTGARPTSAGSPGTATSSTGRSRNGATVLMYEGAPDWPQKDRFWELIERHGVTIFYTAPTAIRAFMRWGTEWPREAIRCQRCACSARLASRSIRKPGCGITTTSAASAARSSTRGGRPKPA